MAVHQPHLHLLDFSAPPNAMPMEAPPPAAFDSDGLLALHVDGTHMPAGGGVLPQGAGDTAPPPWPQAAVSLSLFSYSTATRASSLQVGTHQPFTASVASPSHQLQAPAASLQPFQLRSSKYLVPVMELLSEFCSLEGDFHAMANKQGAPPKAGRWDDDVEAMSSGLWGSTPLSSMDLMELERRKARLLSMVEEVDRRYRRYREQMRSVELSFEAVAGAGAAQVYTRLARRAMSRHFRCLRDALTAQVRALRKAMGAAEMDGGGGAGSAPAGATKGDTPRLRVLDQCLRQPSRAVDSYPWRPQRGLPERAVALLRAWLFEHFLHPYPNAVDKHILSRQTGLSKSQVSNWFINARVRLWKPMIEDMYNEEVKQQNPTSSSSTAAAAIVKAERSTTAFPGGGGESYHHHHHFGAAANHPANNNSCMLSQSSSPSIVTDGDHNLFHSSCYPNLMPPQGSVSLTLGLQHQQPLAASSSMMQMQRSAGLDMFGQQVQEEEQQSVQLPYRNLMGSSQLLQDFDLVGSDTCL